MKQLLILSGKGGTGKTTVASAFIRLSEAQAYADCDVDAPNLHLITKHSKEIQILAKLIIRPLLIFHMVNFVKSSNIFVSLMA